MAPRSERSFGLIAGARRLPTVGREAARSAALTAVDRVAGATGQALFIEGEAGIGKTRLVREVLDDLRSREFTLTHGSGRQLETDLPFAPLIEAFGLRTDAPDDRRASIGRLLLASPDPVEAADPEGGSRQRRMQIVQSVVDLVDELCRSGPLAVVLEDAHWVDGSSLAVVDRLLQRLVHLPLLVVMTARPYPRGKALHGVVDRLLTAGGTHVLLTGLSDEDVAELAAAALGRSPGERVLDELRTVGGNPLFALELLAALEGDGALQVREGVADVSVTQVPPSLRLTVLRRLSVLPEGTVELLRVAAVLGTSFEPAAVAAVSGLSELEVAAALEPARAAGVIDGAQDSVAFHHDLVRDAVYQDLPEAVRYALHAAVARSLAEAGFPAEAVAPHLIRGKLPRDRATVGNLRSVASSLGARAPDLAVDLLQRALDLAAHDDPERDELRLELATALGWAHRPVEAAALAEELLEEVGSGPLRRAALTTRAYQAQFLGGFAELGDQLEAAASEPDASPSERARLLALTAVSRVFSDDPEQTTSVAVRALEAAEQVGDDIAAVATLLAQGMAAQLRWDEDTAIDLGRKAVDIARRSRDPELHRAVKPELSLAMFLGDHARHRQEAIELAREALSAAERESLPGFAAAAQMALGILLYRSGRWDDATTELESAIDRTIEVDETRAGPIDAYCRLSRIATHRDDPARSAQWLDRARNALQHRSVPPMIAVHLPIAQAVHLDALGDRDAACDLLIDAYVTAGPDIRSALSYNLCVPLVRLTVADGHDLHIAERVLSDLVDNGTEPTIPWLRGLIEDRPEDLRTAIDRADEHGTGLREEHPLLLEDAARVLAGHDDADPTELLNQAIDIWEEMGAIREVARLEAHLRQLGVHRGKRGTRQRPDTGWEALTETEQRVVELVAEGLIYREVGERMFISRRTVETHVAHVFAKLGLSSRRELERAYAERADVAKSSN